MPTTEVPASELIAALNRTRPASGGSTGIDGSAAVRLATTDEGLTARVRGFRNRAGAAYLSATTKLDGAGDPLPPVAVSHKTLSGMLRLVENPADKIRIEVLSSDEIQLRLGRSTLKLRAWDDKGLADWAMWPNYETEGEAIGWDASALRDHMRFAAPSASHDDARPILTTMLVDDWGDGRTVVAATDSYRLAVSRFEGTPPPSPLLLPHGLANLMPDEDAHFTLHGSNGNHRGVSWKSGDVEWVSAIVGGEFPNYKGLMPKSHPITVRLERDVAIRVLRRAGLLANLGGINTPVRLAIGYGETSGIMVSAIAQDVGSYEEFLPCDTSGVTADLTVAFNPAYFLAGLQSMQQPIVEFGAIDAQKPAVLETEARTYLLMPVRVS